MVLRVRDRRLVAVMAVGDDHGLRRHQGTDLRDRRVVGHAPEAMPLALEVVRFGDRLSRRRRRAENGAIGITHQHEEQAGVGAGRLQELHPIFLGAAMGSLVREHNALGVLADLAERDEGAAGNRPATERVRLLVRIDGGPIVGGPHALRDPGVEHAARRLVAIDVGLVARRRDPHDVVRTHREEPVLRHVIDLIVRRRDHRRDVHVGGGDAIPAEGLDLHPSGPRSRAPRPSARRPRARPAPCCGCARS